MVGNVDGLIDREGKSLGIWLGVGAGDMEGRKLGLPLGQVLTDGEAVCSVEGYLDTLGGSVGNDNGWLETDGTPLGRWLGALEIE